MLHGAQKKNARICLYVAIACITTEKVRRAKTKVICMYAVCAQQCGSYCTDPL